MVHRRYDPIPRLVRCFAAGALCRRPIEDVDRGVDGLPPELAGKSTRLDHAPGHPDHCQVLPLDDAILLWRVWHRELVRKSELDAVRCEFCRHELSSAIGTQGEELPSALALSCRLDPLDGSRSGVLGVKQRHPHEPVVVVDEEQEVARATRSSHGDWPVEITVEQLEWFDGALQCLAQERGASVLAIETSFAELLHLGQHGKATDEALSPHLPQSGKIGVAEACVLAPDILPGMCGQADWPCNGEVKHV